MDKRILAVAKKSTRSSRLRGIALLLTAPLIGALTGAPASARSAPKIGHTEKHLAIAGTTTAPSAAGTHSGREGDRPGANVFVRPISTGPSVFETDEHRCESPESAAYGYRQEPHLAVNPTDPQNLVAAWRQDLWGGAFYEGEGSAALSTVTAYSTNGGATWTEVVLPGLGVCGGKGLDGVADPTVAFGPDGTAYVSAMQFGGLTQGAVPFHAIDSLAGYINSIFVYRSNDGGRTWSGPFVSQEPDTLNDHATLVADPIVPGRLHLVWTRFFATADTPCGCASVVTARSDDGGETWTERVTVHRREGFVGHAAGLSVLPDGAIVVVIDEVPTAPPRQGLTVPATLHAARSEDGGQTWSRHKVADHTITDASGRDPDSANTIDAPEFFQQQAAGPGDTVYVSWHHNTSISHGEVFVARSDDGGQTWTDPLTVAAPGAQVLNPKIAVADDDSVAVIWADLRNDDDVPGEPDDTELTTDWWSLGRSTVERRGTKTISPAPSTFATRSGCMETKSVTDDPATGSVSTTAWSPCPTGSAPPSSRRESREATGSARPICCSAASSSSVMRHLGMTKRPFSGELKVRFECVKRVEA